MYTILKVDSAGTLQWNKTYAFDAPTNVLRSFIQTSDGGYALLGLYLPSSGQSGGQIWFAKTDASGSIVWNKTIIGPLDNSPNTLLQTDNGGYVIIDSSYELNPSQSAFRLIKTDSDGNIVLNATYGGEGAYHDPECNSGILAADGGYLLAGFLAGRNAWIVKTDSQGVTAWNQTYGDNNSAVTHILQTQDGGYAFTGILDGQVWVAKTDSSGTVDWSTTLSGTTYYFGIESNYESLIQTSDGGYVVAGTKDSSMWLQNFLSHP